MKDRFIYYATWLIFSCFLGIIEYWLEMLVSLIRSGKQGFVFLPDDFSISLFLFFASGMVASAAFDVWTHRIGNTFDITFVLTHIVFPLCLFVIIIILFISVNGFAKQEEVKEINPFLSYSVAGVIVLSIIYGSFGVFTTYDNRMNSRIPENPEA